MDSPFIKNPVALLESSGFGKSPSLTYLSACFNPITGIPLFYAEEKQIRIDLPKKEKETKSDDFLDENDVQFVKGFRVRVLVWQKGHMDDYFSGSEEAVAKWKTAIDYLMKKTGYKFVMFNFNDQKPIQKIIFSENMVLSMPTLAPEVTMTAYDALTRSLGFFDVEQEGLYGVQRRRNPEWKWDGNNKYERTMWKSGRGGRRGIEKVPIIQYIQDTDNFELTIKDGELVAQFKEDKDIPSKRLKELRELAKSKKNTIPEGKQEDIEKTDGDEKKEDDEKSLRSSGLIKKD